MPEYLIVNEPYVTALADDTVPCILVQLHAFANREQFMLAGLAYYQAHSQLDQPPLIALRATRAEGHVVPEVQDNGLGLTESQQQRIFGLFQRLHTHVEGTGVGLYMVKRMVENAGGSIAVQSQPGQGTTFTITFLA